MLRRLLPSILSCAALIAAAVAGPAAAAPIAPGGAVGKATGQSRAQVLAYWTPARMVAAVPRERAKPGGGGGTTSGSYTITKVADTERLAFPGRTNGKVYMTFGGTNYVCSGTAVVSANESTVLTAGHCVWDAASGFATNFLFVPAKSAASEPYGAWAASAVYTTQAWQASEDWSFDTGAAKVSTNSGATLTGTVGGRAITFSGARDQTYTLYGYPASGKYSGQYLYKCATRYAGDDPGSSGAPKPIGVRCKWPGGSSGGAWIGADGNIASVTSFGYATLSDWVFGPYLGTVAQAFYTDVQDN